MNARDEISYRLRLADGFLGEAEQDETLKRWRSCVANAQLATENAGKAVLSLFGIAPKTHDPARELQVVLNSRDVPGEIRDRLIILLPDLSSLGSAEHFMTDYGNETEYVSPWELFTQTAAETSLAAAQRSVQQAKKVIKLWEET